MSYFQGWIALIQSVAAPVLGLVKAKWLRTLVYATALAVVVWFYGSYIRFGTWSPLDSDQNRLYAVGACFVGWLLFLVWWLIIGRRRNNQLIAGLTEGGIDQEAATALEVEQMRQRLQQSLVQLRRLMGGRRGFLYELPWYVLIGPPGSGKTTALRNSGLKFPLAATMGRDPVRGVGGTRNCDWWITEQAILLDTAGRYTTQDSDEAADRGAWQGFLKLLKQYRPLQPINGVIVALSIEEIAAAGTAERLAHAQAVRSRIFELNQAFNTRVPIYVVFTKADLVAGFVEFFDALNRTDREQVWGMTFPVDDGRVDTVAAAQKFEGEFDLLIARLNAVMLERLQQEVDIERRGLVYGFPSQVATMKEPISEFLAETFTTTRFDQRPLLRGMYFASGTQTGAPIDRLMQSMASTFSMSVPRPHSFSGVVKTYFLTRLLDSVVFAEASLASVNLRLQRRRRLIQQGALLAAVVLLVGVGGLWGYSYVENRAMVADLERHVAEYDTAAAAIAPGPVSDTDFGRVVPVLNQVSDGYAILDRRALPPLRPLGLNQNEKLRGQYTDTYVRALDHLLLPRVLVLVGSRLRAAPSDVNAQFETLKVYLGLGNQGPIDKAATAKWLHAAWEAAYPAPEDAKMRADLDRHLAAMLDHPLPTVTLDATLIAEARQGATQRTLPARTYALIRDSAAAQAVPAWRPLDKTGAVGQRVFVRQSGKPLTEGIPGFYTRRGYFDVLLPQMSQAIEQARGESWVYAGQAASGETRDTLAPQIIALYKNDFDTDWRTMLGDIRVMRFGNVDQAVQVLNGLSGPASTLRKLLTAVAEDTDLTPPPADTKDEGEQKARRLAMQFAVGASAPTPTFPGLGEATHSPTGEVAETVRTLDTLYNQVSKVAAETGTVTTSSQSETGVIDAVQLLTSNARRMPTPSDAWMIEVGKNVTVISSGIKRDVTGKTWAQTGGKFCKQAVGDHYPFNRSGRSDISLDDFDKLFAPGGVFDKFFETNLKPNVNQSTSPWQWQFVGMRPSGSDALAQFERAAAIRQAFYNPNSSRLGVEVEITPASLDSGATGVTLEFGEQALTWRHDPVRPTTVRWPSASNREARIAFQPATPNAGLSVAGPWALFRLFDTAEQQPLSRDSSMATFSIGGHSAAFNVRSSSVLSPLRLPELRAFRCPEGL